MIHQDTITRAGKEYTVVRGYTEDFKSRIYVDHHAPHPEYNLPIRDRVKRMVVDFGPDGELLNIQTTWKRSLLAEGKEITGTGNDLYMVTNATDKAAFVGGLSPYIVPPIINGYVKAILGHNNLPLFAPDGSILTYTTEQEQLPPTNDYHPAP